MGSLLLVWSLTGIAQLGPSADSIDGVLAKIEQAASSMETFRATSQCSSQWRFAVKRTAAGEETVFLDEPHWPDPRDFHECDLTVSGDRFRMSHSRQMEAGRPRQKTEWAFDGKVCYGYEAGEHRGQRRRKYLWIAGRPMEARHLAYRLASGEPRIDQLQAWAKAGQLTVSEAQIEGRPVILLEHARAQTPDVDQASKLWIDPARGFLPVQIEDYRHGKLIHRIVDIKHQRIDGVWFPISGTLQHIENKDADHIGIIRSTVHLETDPASVDLHPRITADTFRLEFPIGTEVRDELAGANYVVTGQDGQLLDQMVKQVAGERQAMASSRPADALAEAQGPSPASPGKLPSVPIGSSAGASRPIGRYVLWFGLLIVLGFVSSWLLARRKAARGG